ncbi:MAG: hypothetical protein JEZ06_13360 [Anaerolineaceae bacterium]|nr:hypothetical protein [Anaerolineaceae bacterium]
MAKLKITKKMFWIILGLESIVILVIGTVIWQGIQKPKSSLSDDSTIINQAEAEIPEGEAFVMSLLSGEILPVLPNDIMVFVPGTAASMPGTMEISLHNPDILTNGGDPEWVRLQVVNIELKDNQGKISTVENLPTSIEVCFTLDDKTWADYQYRSDAYQVQYYTKTVDGIKWTFIDTLAYPERQQICGLTQHLSFFGLAVNIDFIPTATMTPTSEDTATPESSSTATKTPDGSLTPTDIRTGTVEPSGTPTKTPSATPTEEDLPVGS